MLASRYLRYYRQVFQSMGFSPLPCDATWESSIGACQKCKPMVGAEGATPGNLSGTRTTSLSGHLKSDVMIGGEPRIASTEGVVGR